MDLVLKRGGITKKVLLEDAMHHFFNHNYRELLPPRRTAKIRQCDFMSLQDKAI